MHSTSGRGSLVQPGAGSSLAAQGGWRTTYRAPGVEPLRGDGDGAARPVTTTYTNDVFRLTQVLVADDGTTQVYNLFSLDLISQDSGSEARTLLVDGLGSVRLETVDGAVEAVTTYSPYGEVLSQSGTSGTVYGFTGEQEDSATGLLYLRARYYDSYLNRFLSADTIVPDFRNPQNLNLHAYANNNPVNWVDPSGHLAQAPAGGAYSCGSLEECQWAAEQLDGGEPSGSCGPDCAWVIGPGGKRYEYSISEIQAETKSGGMVLEIILSVVCEPLDWYFTLKDGLQWHDAIGLLPVVPGAIGRHGDEAAGIIRRGLKGLEGASDVMRPLGEAYARRAKGFYALLDAHGVSTSDVTVAVSEAYINGKWVEVVALNAQASDEAANVIREAVSSSDGVFLRGWAEMHPEEALYRAYASDGIQAIGVSHYRGPCPSCTTFLENNQFLDVYWISTYD